MTRSTLKETVTFAYTLDHETEIDSLPSEISSYTVGISWNVASKHHLVIFRSYTAIRLSVRSADILILDITRLIVITQDYRYFRQAIVVVLGIADPEIFGTHKAISDITIECIYRITHHSDLIAAQVGRIATKVHNTVLYIRKIEAHSIVEVSPLFTPSQVEFPSAVVYLSYILLRRLCTDLRRVIELEKNTFSILVIPVECHCKTVVKHRDIHSDIKHLYSLPCQIRICKG